MALCLANSLIACQDFVPYDQLVRYKWWYRHGYMSSTGQCFDIGAATQQSIEEFEKRQRKFAHDHGIPFDQLDFLSNRDLLQAFDVKCSKDDVAGNGALMRLAPVPLFFYHNPELAIEYSGISGRITHGDDKAYDACCYYGALIIAALNGANKNELTSKTFYDKHRHWFGNRTLHPEIMAIAHGSYKKPGGYQDGIRGKGYIVNALEAALWAFWSDEDSFEKGALNAVNLGDDTDTTAAIYGQLAGAYYGYKKLPVKWLECIYAKDFIQCKKMVLRTLSAVDYVLLILLLLSSAVIGAIFGFFKSKKSSAKEFMIADGGMGVFPTALSIMVSFLSAITLLGTPSEIYMYGTMYCYQAVSWAIASTVTALVFMPKFREMNFTSAYEYLEKRFDRSVRMCASFAFSFGMGGMKAVIWTDVLQAIVILVGLLATIIQGIIAVGGIELTFSKASKGGRIQFDSGSFDPRVRHTIWSLLIGGSLNSLSMYSFNQTQIQRYMCVRTTHGAKQALFINAAGTALIILSSSLIGIILYAFYVDCDPYTAKYVSDIDQIFPYFVMDVLSSKKGLPGIFLACVFSGSLSTISSGLNSLAAVVIEDVYKGLMGRTLSDERQGLISKIFSIVLGAVVMLLTYVVSYLGSILNAALSLSGVLSGPITGVFFLGFFFPQVNRRGGLVGFLASLFVQCWIFLGAQLTKKQMKSARLPLSVANCPTPVNITIPLTTSIKANPLLGFYSISYMWYTPIGVTTVIIVGVIVSYLTRPLKSNEIDPKLIIRISNVNCCCLPKCIHDWIRYGVKEDVNLEKKNNNDIKSLTSEENNIFHTNNSVQTLNTATKDFIPLNVVIENKMDNSYDNPVITMKD
ncbi:unnamed protein product [Rotaria sp. Silwood1]|nr:unnamed protein product [Rotaria sp. Silwood1]